MTHLTALSRAESETPSRRTPAWLIPSAILAGFVLLFLLLFRDRLLPAVTVEVEQVVSLASEHDGEPARPGTGTGGAMLFQASGWIEPDPYMVKATALIDGVIDEVSVLEGDTVKKGEVLATLIADDAKLTLEARKRELDGMRSAREAHCAGIDRTIKELQTKQAEEKSAQSLLEEANDQLKRLEKLKEGAVSERDRVEARLAAKRFEALAIAAGGRVMELAAELNRAAFETVAMEHRIAAAEVGVQEAELALERTTISSPIDGRVLRLMVAPGQKRMLGMDDPDSSTVALLYDPERLQVRVDVPLADAARLEVGQAARIRCNLLPDRVFTGRVTRIVGEADLQRNTLQAKVEIHDPSDALRPEMLCRVEFLDSGSMAEGADGGGALDVWMPESAAAGGVAWVFNPDGRRLEKRGIELGGESRDGRLRVAEGLRPGEWVVVSPEGLRNGQRAKTKGGRP